MKKRSDDLELCKKQLYKDAYSLVSLHLKQSGVLKTGDTDVLRGVAYKIRNDFEYIIEKAIYRASEKLMRNKNDKA